MSDAPRPPAKPTQAEKRVAKAVATKPVATKPPAKKPAAKKPAAKTPAAKTLAPKAASKPARALKRPRYTKAEAELVFQTLAEALPEPETELEYSNPFTLLVAVVLSAQATDVGVNKATRPMFAIAATPQAILDLGEDRVRDFIKTIGLFNMKAKNVIALSKAIVEEHGGEVPRNREALQALPGVGRKTANVVLNVAFGQPTIAVDTHIFRVSNRLGIAPGKTPDDVEAMLEKVTPERYKQGVHHWLILHGRHVCKARRPLCDVCVIYDLCKSPERLPRVVTSQNLGESPALRG